jgi:phosphoribosylformimino-5-aminoimidazole carboxamide ribotide isomerase
MIIIPAIDIMSGRVVRLQQGDFNRETVYSGDPLMIARNWIIKGAKFLHLVDLDGARDGKVKNADVIARILENIKIKCEVGGGLRDEKDIEWYLKKGAARVVLGTRAFEDMDYLEKLLSKFNEKIVVSVDFRGDNVVKKGWQEVMDLNPIEVIGKMQGIGIKTLIVTDITVDGTLIGPNINRLKEILEKVNINIIASGGVSSVDDIKNLKGLKAGNLEGVIIGKALYEGKLDLQEAVRIAEAV